MFANIFTKYKKIYFIFIFAFIFWQNIFIIGCTKKNADPIVIPPGSEVKYSNERFLKYSGTAYKMTLNQYQNDFVTSPTQISDLTPSVKKSEPQNLSFLFPKNIQVSEKCIYVIQSSLDQFGISLNAIVMNDEVNYPSVESTILYDLIANIPGKKVTDINSKALKNLQLKINELSSQINSKYKFDATVTIKQTLRFYKNYLSSNLDFLKTVETELNFKFNYTADGIITTAPFPFGQKNSFPELDTSLATPNNKPLAVSEMTELIIKGKVYDRDSDMLFYQWELEGETVNTIKPDEFTWQPDYDAAKGELYFVKLIVTDGSKPIEITWSVNVINTDRIPILYFIKPDASCSQPNTDDPALKCPSFTKENTLWTCKACVTDFDKDSIKWVLNDKSSNSRLSVNGIEIDSTHNKIVNNVNEVLLSFTPNNIDAKNHSSSFVVTVDDGLGGIKMQALTVGVDDVNQAPVIISPVQFDINNPKAFATPVPINMSSMHEYDSGRSLDPDSGLNIKPIFEIVIKDPDNDNIIQTPALWDVDTANLISVTSSNGSNMKVDPKNNCFNPAPSPWPTATGIPIPIANCGCVDKSGHTHLCFEWTVEDFAKTGSLRIQLNDDHGAKSDIYTIPLSAEDRNQLPNLKISTNSSNTNLSSLSNEQIMSWSFTASDNDLNTRPALALQLLNEKYAHHFSDQNNNWINTRKNFGEPNFLLDLPIAFDSPTQSSSTLLAKYYSPYSGFVTIHRSVRKGTDCSQYETLTAPFKFQSKKVLPTDINLTYTISNNINIGNCAMDTIVPIIRDGLNILSPPKYLAAPVGKITRFVNLDTNLISSQNIKVTNNSILTDNGTVVVSRTNANLALTIPSGTIVSSDESLGNESFQYEFSANAQLDTNVLNGTFAVARVPIILPPHSIVFKDTPPNPDLTVDNNYELNETSISTSDVYKNSAPIPIITLIPIAQDTASLPIKTTFHLSITPLPIPNNLPLLIEANTTMNKEGGNIKITRQDNGAIATIVPQKILSVPDGTTFYISSPISIAANSSVNVDVQNIHNSSLLYSLPNDPSTHFSSQNISFPILNANHKPIFTGGVITAATFGFNQIGSTAFRFYTYDNQITGKSNVLLDPQDRFTFNISSPFSPAIPAGTYKFCREPGTNNAPDITSDFCTPCDNSSLVNKWNSMTCYFRYKPSYNDISDSAYSISLSVNDNGSSYGDSQIAGPVNFIFKVNEVPSTPLFAQNTSSTGTPNYIPVSQTFIDSSTPYIPTAIPTATPQMTAIASLGSFSQNQTTTADFFVIDNDKITSDNVITKIEVDTSTQTLFDIATQSFVDYNSLDSKPNFSASAKFAKSNVYNTGTLAASGSWTQWQMTWTPSDQVVKALAGPLGFLIRIKITAKSNMTAIGYYRGTMTNSNFGPTMSIVNTSNGSATTQPVIIWVDSFYDSNSSANGNTPYYLKLTDPDYQTTKLSDGSTFTPILSLCSTTVFNCNMADDLILKSPLRKVDANPNYMGNMNVSSCRINNKTGTTSLPEPSYFSPYQYTINTGLISSPATTTKAQVKNYGIRWCPQRSHIGKWTLNFQYMDNGDGDRTTVGTPSQTSDSIKTFPLNISVVSDIFFQSPNMDPTGTLCLSNCNTQAISYEQTNVFSFKPLLNNSLNNAVNYSITGISATPVSSPLPTICPANSNINYLISNDCILINTTTGELKWIPKSIDENKTFKVSFSAYDTVRKFTTKAYVNISVKNFAGSKPPTISAISPTNLSFSIDEGLSQNMSITAGDLNSTDILSYRWYIDNVIVDMSGNNYIFKPNIEMGYLSMSSYTPGGKHEIKVEVTDGNNIVSNTWLATIRNVTPSPKLILDLFPKLTSDRLINYTNTTIFPPTIKNEIGYSASASSNFYYVSGQYNKANKYNMFVLGLPFNNGQLVSNPITSPKSISTPVAYFNDTLPWLPLQAGGVPACTQRSAIYNDGSKSYLILTSVDDRPSASAINNSSSGVKLIYNSDFSTIAANGWASVPCTSGNGCANYFYKPTFNAYGAVHSLNYNASGTNFIIYSDKGLSSVYVDSGNPTNSITIKSYSVGKIITGMTKLDSLNRLYVAVQDTKNNNTFIDIFDLSPLKSATPSLPNLLYTKIITLPPTAFKSDGKPLSANTRAFNGLLDLVAVESVNTVYGLLSIAGGILKLVDNGNTQSDFYLGVDKLYASKSDFPLNGRKLVFNTKNNLIYGIIHDSSQVFTVDPFTNSVSVYPTPESLDSVEFFTGDGMIIYNNRSFGHVYQGL